MTKEKTGLELAYSEYVEWNNSQNKHYSASAQKLRDQGKKVKSKFNKTMYIIDFIERLLTDDEFHNWWDRDCTTDNGTSRILKEPGILEDKPRTKEGFYACTSCKGMKINPMWDCISCKVYQSEHEFFSTGLRVDELANHIIHEKNLHSQTKKYYKILGDSVKKNSTCSKCCGDQDKTPGGIECEECGIIGMAPWGG